jgi:uncharacterized protein YceK
MSQHDDHLPEDLRDIAARLSAARSTPSALELDELRRRVHGRVGRAGRTPQRRSFARVLRMNFVAVMLTMGLVLTSGVGVVLAGQSFGGGGDSNTYGNTSFKGYENASWCQYHGPWSSSWSGKTKHSSWTVSVVWDCKHLTVHFSCGESFGYKFGNGSTYDIKETSYTTTAPNGASGLTFNTDGSTVTLPFSW